MTGLLSAIAGLALLLTSCTDTAPLPPPRDLGEHTVYRVVDGDTIRVNDLTGADLGRVRLIGIDAPELSREGAPDECHAQEAAGALAQLVDGKTVRLLTDPTQPERDRYGRILAYVELEQVDAGRVLVSQGHAAATTHDHQRREDYEAAETPPRAADQGVWSCRSSGLG